ncbi:tautomerase family protein [Arthrobacter sp. ISL-69]|uniref:tautomerase family protein n=1 Tax=Arthrobacter sp. ISL-69 TaxID=2819113 RepID=UPI001BE67930|nr:tautomerase family protein [Arthrobacter sp. ISL-69]MBT2539021.1 tautomerase family protein [Arthrobacter sp. ISL-69]
MPVFEAHVPAGRYTTQQKRALADALNQSLVQGLGVPEGDRFIMITEHGDAELFLHPTFMGMDRSDDAMFITVFVGAHRPLDDKQTLAAHISRLATEALGISPDDIFITLVPVPNDNFSFGRGELQLAEVAPRW